MYLHFLPHTKLIWRRKIKSIIMEVMLCHSIGSWWTGATASATMVLTYFARCISVSAPEVSLKMSWLSSYTIYIYIYYWSTQYYGRYNRLLQSSHLQYCTKGFWNTTWRIWHSIWITLPEFVTLFHGYHVCGWFMHKLLQGTHGAFHFGSA